MSTSDLDLETEKKNLEQPPSDLDNPNDPPREDDSSKLQLEKLMADNKALRAQVMDLRKNEKSREVEGLRKNQEWERVAKIREEELEATREELQEFKTSFVDEKIFDAIQKEALKAGIKKEALEDVELLDLKSMVEVELTSRGRVNVIGAASAVQAIKTSRPHWFGGRKTSINNGDGRGSDREAPSNSTPESLQEHLDLCFKLQKKAKETGTKSDRENYFKELDKYNKRKNGLI